MKYLKYGNLYPIDRFSLSGGRVEDFYVDAKEGESILSEIVGAYDISPYASIEEGAMSIYSNKLKREFMDAFREKRIKMTLGQSAANASVAYDYGINMLRDDFLGVHEKDEAAKFKKKFIESRQYDPGYVYRLFAAAKANPKYYNQHDKISKDIAALKKSVYSQMIDEFVAGGGDIETIRYMLNKQIKCMQKEIEENPNCPETMSEALEPLEDLQLKAYDITSPYDKIFNFSTSIVREQKKLGELAQDPNTSQEMLDKMEAQIYEMQHALEKEMSKWDPEMLMQVAESRKKNINLDAENEKGITNYSKSQVEALKGVTQIQQIAKRQIQRERDAEADRGY